MPEIIKAAPALGEAMRVAQARAYGDRLKAIMNQVGENGRPLIVEMQNHLISLNQGRTLDRNAGIALMILIAQNSIAEWLVDDDASTGAIAPDDPRLVAIEALQALLVRKALRERSAEKLARANGVEGHA